jgi:hypothetical protein
VGYIVEPEMCCGSAPGVKRTFGPVVREEVRTPHDPVVVCGDAYLGCDRIAPGIGPPVAQSSNSTV